MNTRKLNRVLRTPIEVGRATRATAQRPSKIGLIAGSKRKRAPKRQLGDQTKHERSTMDLPGAGEDRGREGNTPTKDSKSSRCQFVVREKLNQKTGACLVNQPAIIGIIKGH